MITKERIRELKAENVRWLKQGLDGDAEINSAYNTGNLTFTELDELLALALRGIAASKLEKAIEKTQGLHFTNQYDSFYRDNHKILREALEEYRKETSD